MAGIGQRFTSADHSAHWNTQSQYTMGRAMMHDLGKPIANYAGNFNKRALFGGTQSGVVGPPTFSDIANLCASGYTSRPGSSQHNGDVLGSLSSGFSVRSAFPSAQDHSNPDANSPFFNPAGFNGAPSGPPRNFSEPSLFPSLSVNRTVGTDLNSGRIGSSNANSKTSAVDGLSMSHPRNPGTSGNLFSTSLTGDNTGNNSSNLPTSSSASRGMKLDPSEFPPILTSVGRSGNVTGSFPPLSNQPPLRNYVSVMSKGSPASDSGATQFSSGQSAVPEFSKQDFPALPGSNQQHSSASSSVASGQSSTLSATNSANPGLSRTLPHNAPAGSGNRTTNPGNAQQFNTGSTTCQSSAVAPTGSIQLLANHFVANISKNMICDPFGMIGLLKLIHIGAYDAALNMLAPGSDLSSLHNNWQTAGELHNTFVSPCHESCIGRPQDMDYAVPPEYLIRHLIADRLPDPPMDQLSEETLFWLFYNCCREETQLVVAKELYQREWRFHKKEKIWLTRNVNSNFTTDNNSEQGDYFYWDPLKAQKSTLHMTILYSDLDNAPKSFRLSSGTLNAFVNTSLHNATVSHTHHSTTPANVQQLQLAAYQQQQGYSTHHSLLSNNQQTGNNSTLPNALHHGPASSLMTQGPTGSGSSGSTVTLANLFNNARQPSKTQIAQLNPANYMQPGGLSHARTNTGLTNPNTLFASRSGPTGTASISPTMTTASLISGSLTASVPTTSTAVSSNPSIGSKLGNTTEPGLVASDSSSVRPLSSGVNATTNTSAAANDSAPGGSSSLLDAAPSQH